MSAFEMLLKKDFKLENNRVKLEPIHISHIDSLEAISHDKTIWKYILEADKEEDWFTHYCQAAIQNLEYSTEIPFVIHDKVINRISGMTRIYGYDKDLKVMKIGQTWLAKDTWGTGLNKHVKFLLLDYIFEFLGMERVGFGVHEENVRSINALESLGCKLEGTLRNYLPKIGEEGRADLLLFGILRKEWELSIREALQKRLKDLGR